MTDIRSMPSVLARCAAWRTPHVYCGYSPRCSDINVVNVLLIDAYANAGLMLLYGPGSGSRRSTNLFARRTCCLSKRPIIRFMPAPPICSNDTHMRNIRRGERLAHCGAVRTEARSLPWGQLLFA